MPSLTWEEKNQYEKVGLGLNYGGGVLAAVLALFIFLGKMGVGCWGPEKNMLAYALVGALVIIGNTFLFVKI